jgi:hypothetical protein
MSVYIRIMTVVQIQLHNSSDRGHIVRFIDFSSWLSQLEFMVGKLPKGTIILEFFLALIAALYYFNFLITVVAPILGSHWLEKAWNK